MSQLSLLALLSFLIYLNMGYYTFSLDRKSVLNRLFLYVCIVFANWSFIYMFFYSATTKEECWIWYRLGLFSTCTFSSVILHFFLIFTNNTMILKKFKQQIYLLLYLPPVIFIANAILNKLFTVDFQKVELGWVKIVPIDNIWLWSYFFYIFILTVTCVFLIYSWGRQVQSKKERKQARIILYSGIATFIICIINDQLLPLLGIYVLPPLCPVIVLAWGFSVLYPIMKFKIMNAVSAVAVEKILEKVSNIIILLDKDCKIIRININAKKMLGLNTKELIGCNFLDIIRNYQELYNLIQRIVISEIREDVMEIDCKVVNKVNCKTREDPLVGNEEVYIKLHVSAIIGKSDDLLGIIIIGQDMTLTRNLKQEITDRKNVEQELRESNVKLKELDKIKTDFLSIISHELRTPLTSIIGFSKIINKKLKNVILQSINEEDKKMQKVIASSAENVDIIISEGERLTDLINDVLYMAKMEALEIDWKMGKISINMVLNEAIKTYISSIDQKGIELVRDFIDEEIFIFGDFEKLVKVVSNLISNAIKFTDKGSITCKVIKSDEKAIISIIDTGIGITEEDEKQVFDKFRQIGDTLTNKPKGTGLGLAICKEIIKHHNGDLWVKGNLGAGSNFSFSLWIDQKGE